MKTKKISRFVSVLLCFVISLALLCSCRGNSKGKSLYWLLDSSPRNLDPQTATSESEMLLIKNCFTPLFEKNEEGKLVSSLVYHYDISKDGLTYIFYLNDDIYWSHLSDGKIKKYTPIIADDFVFAIERVFKDNPDADIMRILCDIKNADKVTEGENLKKLSVTAKDDKTLVIKLSRKNPALPEAFCDPALFPCNRKFFNSTSGRYGLSTESMLFNGSFILSAWGESSLKLTRNKFSSDKPKVDNITLYQPKSTREHINLLKEGEIDAAFLSSEQYLQIPQNSTFNVKERTSKVWVILFNESHELWRNKNLRDAFISCTDRDSIEKNEHFKVSRYLITDTALVYSSNYRKNAADIILKGYNPNSAKEHYSLALSELAKTDILNAEILIPDLELCKNSFASLNQIYQRDLSLYFSPKYLSTEDILKKVKSKDFAAALVPLNITYDTPSAILEYFIGTSPSCILNISDENFINSYTDAINTSDESTAINSFKGAEKALFETSLVAPLYFENGYFVSSSSISGFYIDASGAVIFKNADKK